jgi:hypothetical protein
LDDEPMYCDDEEPGLSEFINIMDDEPTCGEA